MNIQIYQKERVYTNEYYPGEAPCFIQYTIFVVRSKIFPMKTVRSLFFFSFMAGFLLIGCGHSTGDVLNHARILPPDTLVEFQPDWQQLPGGPADLSFQLMKPAGRNGFIELRGSHFYTPDGARFRVWGVNFTGGACFPEKESAPECKSSVSV